jgi:hypothetical protein
LEHDLDSLISTLASRETELDFADTCKLASAKTPAHPPTLAKPLLHCTPTLDRLTEMVLSNRFVLLQQAASAEPIQAHASKLGSLTSRLDAIDKSCAQLGAEAMVVEAEISSLSRTLRAEEARVAASVGHRLEMEAELARAQAASVDLASQISMQKARRAELNQLQAALQELKSDNDEIDAYRTNLRSSLQKELTRTASNASLASGLDDDDDRDAFSLRSASAGAAKKPRTVRFSSPTRVQTKTPPLAAASSDSAGASSSSSGSAYKNIFLRKYFQPPS